jgi:hypothetical protein
VVLGALSVADDPAEVPAQRRAALILDCRGEPFGGVEAGLDPLGELDLERGGQQPDLADLREVGPDRVDRRGELGVFAGLPQRLGFLLVPNERVRYPTARRRMFPFACGCGRDAVFLGGRQHVGAPIPRTVHGPRWDLVKNEASVNARERRAPDNRKTTPKTWPPAGNACLSKQVSVPSASGSLDC